jgi:hypothetical protein
MTSITEAVLEARKEIPNIVTDETATITGTKGSFKFKYATLAGILETIVPILVKHGVLLLQKVTGENRSLEVETVLIGADGHISSGKIRMDYDGTTRDLAGKATSVKRVQLVALLGLTVVDDDDATTATTAPPPRGIAPGRTAPQQTTNILNAPTATQEHLMRAAQAGRTPNSGRSTGLQTLMLRLQQGESSDTTGHEMPTRPAEGKSTSMYHYLVDQVSQQTLCYLYGRVISVDTPPLLSTRWFLEEVMKGEYTDELAEAYVKAR